MGLTLRDGYLAVESCPGCARLVGRAWWNWTGSLAPWDAAVNLVDGVVSLVAPKSNAAIVTKMVASWTPTQTLKQLTITTIDTIDAAIRGDGNRAIQIHEQRLTGQYGSPVQGYALAADFVAALCYDQQSEMFKVSDAAASGKLGPLAHFGDWLGDQIYDYVSLVEAARDPKWLRARYLP